MFYKGHPKYFFKHTEEMKKHLSLVNSKPKIKKNCLVCQKEILVQPYNEKRKKFCSRICLAKKTIAMSWIGRKHTKEELQKMSLVHKNKPRILTEQGRLSFKEKMSGINNWKWIKDRSLLKDDNKDRGGQLSRDWGRNVKFRDSWKCRIANENCSGRPEAHHILSWANYPELRYNLDNGRTLCKKCHKKKTAYESYSKN